MEREKFGPNKESDEGIIMEELSFLEEEISSEEEGALRRELVGILGQQVASALSRDDIKVFKKFKSGILTGREVVAYRNKEVGHLQRKIEDSTQSMRIDLRKNFFNWLANKIPTL